MGKDAQEKHKKCAVDEYLRKESTLSLSRASSYNVEERRDQLWKSFDTSSSSSSTGSSVFAVDRLGLGSVNQENNENEINLTEEVTLTEGQYSQNFIV